MPSIHIRGLGHAHLPTEPVLRDVTLDLHPDPDATRGDWIGVVGANGAGKSTLLALLSGAVPPTHGSVTVVPTATVHRVPQEADAPTEAVWSFAWDWDGTAQRLRRRLLLDPDDLADTGPGWHGLSPGQRTRWLLGAALAAEVDVLLLDEPTNHLDAEGRRLLLEALRLHRGLGLVVSHDRALLDTLTRRTLRVHDHGLTLHTGSYGEASARWRAAEQQRRAADDDARRVVRKEQAQLGDLRRARHGAEASAARDRRLAGPRDSDAREVGRKNAAAKAEAALARRVAAQHSRVERAAAARGEGLRRDHRGAVGFHAGALAAGGSERVLAGVRGEVEHGGGAVLLRDVDVTLRAGQRVHLVGANGAGKTTLLRALLASVPPSVTVATLPQRASDDVLAQVVALDPARRGRVLGTAARLGIDPDRVLLAARTTPGERRKLALSWLLTEEADLLVLDEPTNHLDLPAVEALQAALAAWPGTLLLVTHDQQLAAAVTTERWTVAGGRVTR